MVSSIVSILCSASDETLTSTFLRSSRLGSRDKRPFSTSRSTMRQKSGLDSAAIVKRSFRQRLLIIKERNVYGTGDMSLEKFNGRTHVNHWIGSRQL